MTPRGRTLALLCATQFLLVLDVTVVGVALPEIRSELGFDAAGLQWVVSAYVLAFGGLLLVAGGLAAGPGALVAARALQGGGAALATPAALALVTTTFPDGPERTRALGIW